MTEREVTLAAVAGAHGVGGEVRLKLFAAELEGLKRHERVKVGDRDLTLVAVRAGANPIVRFAEIGDRSEAEGLRGQLLTVPRSALPPLAQGEYYHADLIGLACERRDGDPLGTVAAVENFGAGDLLDIARPDGRRALVPFRAGIAELVEGRIVVDPEFLG